MSKNSNSNILYLIPLFFALILSYRIIHNYKDIQKREYNFAKAEAEVLNTHLLENRSYYQKLFLTHTLQLNKETLKALPAYSSSIISKEFSEKNRFKVEIKTVSNRARNIKNTANQRELKAIEYFNKNPHKKEYFSDDDPQVFQYASVLKIKKSCLLCHGKKEDAPLFIQKSYPNAYNYKIGDIRGIVSISIPKDKVKEYFWNDFKHATLYDVTLFLLLFSAVYYLIRESNSIHKSLQEEIQKKTKEIKKSLVIDNLTSLPNRLQLIEDLEQDEALQKNQALAILDIDKFKNINDFYGANFADVVLKNIASTIQSFCTKKGAKIYKLPGDEYVIYINTPIEEKEFLQKIKIIVKTIQETQYIIHQNTIYATLSCGIAFNTKDILTKADMALRNAKEQKKSFIIYNDTFDLTQQIDENYKGITLLKNAFANDTVVPFFQPIYNVHTDKIEKYESLVRIVQDDEIIAPYRFLDIAIKAKLYTNITRIMVEKTFSFFKDKHYEFSINLSINDITDKRISQFIIEKLKNFNTPHHVVFEILETDKVEDYQILKEFIQEVKSYGAKIAIDDFGSGYSNFSHILELNVDYLKIDASLVKYITTDENSKKIIKTIINFASDMELKTIAEYVEDKASLELLKKMGVDYIQGYYIGKPAPTLQEKI